MLRRHPFGAARRLEFLLPAVPRDDFAAELLREPAAREPPDAILDGFRLDRLPPRSRPVEPRLADDGDTPVVEVLAREPVGVGEVPRRVAPLRQLAPRRVVGVRRPVEHRAELVRVLGTGPGLEPL